MANTVEEYWKLRQVNGVTDLCGKKKSSPREESDQESCRFILTYDIQMRTHRYKQIENQVSILYYVRVFASVTVRIAGVLRYDHPNEETAPQDGRERVIRGRVHRIVHIIDASHLGRLDEGHQEHQDEHSPA